MTDTYTQPGFDLDTQLVVTDKIGSRIFIDTNGDIVLRIPMVANTGFYRMACEAFYRAVYADGMTIYDRDEKMDFQKACRGW